MNAVPKLNYNRQIDGLRCFAVLGVLIFHFIHFENVYIGRLPLGQGVNLFFVISGYLITKILLINKEKIKLKETSFGQVIKSFYFRRSLRIFPIYYLTILFLVLINFQNTKDVLVWLVTYTTNFYVSNNLNPYIGSFTHLWSLAVEEQFYLVWPFLILFLPKRHIEKTIIAIIVLSVIFKVTYFLTFGYSGAINALTISCADSLGFGALTAYWSIYRQNLLTRINKFKYSVPVSFLPFAYFIIYPRDYNFIVVVGNNFLFSVFAFFIIIRASQMKFTSLTKVMIESKLAIHIGKISYGLYLYHYFMPDFYNQMIDLFPQYFYSDSPYKIFFLFLFSLIFAEISWFAIEKPILKLKSWFQYSKNNTSHKTIPVMDEKVI